MTLAFSAFLVAIFATIKRWKIVFFLFCFNAAFAALVAYPLISDISREGGYFGGLADFIRSFNPEIFLDFKNTGNGTVDMALSQAGFLGLLYFFLYNILTAGVTVILADPRETTTLKTFFRSCGFFAFRFMRLFFYYAVLLVLIALLNSQLNKAVCWLFEEMWNYSAGSETLGWVLLAKNVLMLVVLGYGLLSFNYAKAAVVIEDGHFMGYYFLRGIGFTLSHFFLTGLYFVLSLIPFLIAILFYIIASRAVDPLASYTVLGGILPWEWIVPGGVVYILVAQVAQILFQACLIQRLAGQIFIFRKMFLPTSHPDPDLQKNIPDSYFVVDKPEPGPLPGEGSDYPKAEEGPNYA